ncbi:hypothetical protein F5B22DRAFT_641772 [Xylaria bambusicola]|uniref:uncharacterized protein n=1 Tax=Xylaria bambusicola TaxID=326684 RepID=UPI002007CCAB|nr:uncharacterized protein F5B22DRAFT_641772 [Xylaria bambusicola]KAI0526630.1 hypothetical protein F5B22DRAFT_641772 [Xylaria bambusicola]
METINNMAASAAKAVWGESNPTTEEPVSGRVGDTSKGEPYDAGNMEPISGDQGKVASTEDTAGNTTHSQVNGEAAESAQFAKTTGTAAEGNDTPNNPSNDLKVQSGPDDTSSGQGDTRPPEDPKTNPKSAPTDVNDADEAGVNEAQKLDGPGPKPLAEVAKENGGDAGNDSSSSVDKTKAEDEKKEVEDDDSKKSSGTGEQYVKSSGLQADGGDFDATNPGAGREADRLMEEKGIHNSADSSSGPADNNDSPTSGKKSLGQKIKDKLHRH